MSRILAILLAVLALASVAISGMVAAAEDGGLEGSLRDQGTVITFLFAVSLVLVFLLGYAIRDVLQKRGQRLRSMKKPENAPRRG
ncbi:MAG TPA: hypothetical protein VIB49_05945 [Thermoplasmata archaeon]|jgi:hypothetical protein